MTMTDGPATRRRTACPFCGGTLREARDGSVWNCDRCARKYDPEEVDP